MIGQQMVTTTVADVRAIYRDGHRHVHLRTTSTELHIMTEQEARDLADALNAAADEVSRLDAAWPL